MASSSQKDLFTSVISEIKNYAGDDPLRPWVRGIRKIHQSLPTHVLSEKLPRFLQKCAETFESDRRYRNDSRYLTVWIQLMDYVEDAALILRKMEKSQIGLKRAKFYIAYALYYEKKKRFEDAEKIYLLGVQKIAEPIGELQKSYDQFLHRMKLLKYRSAKREALASIGATTTGHSQKTSTSNDLKNQQSAESIFKTDPVEENSSCKVVKKLLRPQSISINDLDKSAPLHRDGVGLSQVDDPHHHDLSDPAINMEESMNVTSNMFNEVKQKPNQSGNTIEVFADGGMEESGDVYPSIISNTRPVSAKFVNSDSPKRNDNTELQKPFVGAFNILPDEEDDDVDEDSQGDCMEMEEPKEVSCQQSWPTSHSITETGRDNFDVRLKEDTVFRRLKEDTVIRKIVGSTVFEEPKVENACHHGLVDPTINLKQAIDDINGMFGTPLNFVKARKSKKQEKHSKPKADSSKHGFFILSDDTMEKNLNVQAPPCISSCSNGTMDFLEPTVFTKEAMNEINDLFGKPLDF
ncbi:uncharacterized protein LOC110033737 [Phalaenopsis equestris]|uniref:uncharacterized protein LOC110033737 n=1 Tax=Phalaenopsis equestris TaxID=78828 RepID=UPI0009E4194C|nr:uncharacterized protein LOC110033737 [Phalaenopsis equestris]